MFQQSGLQAGPTTGNVDVNPATLIPDNGLAIAQVAQLQASLSQKHPLFGPGDLLNVRVAGLNGDNRQAARIFVRMVSETIIELRESGVQVLD